MNEKISRIYVVVDETVQVGEEKYSVEQVPGRIAAQCAHVVSRVRTFMQTGGWRDRFSPFEPITTIVLSVKDSKELHHIQRMLQRLNIDHQHFLDTNEEVYGWNSVKSEPYHVMTALATFPYTQYEVDDVLGHLPPWSPKVSA